MTLAAARMDGDNRLARRERILFGAVVHADSDAAPEPRGGGRPPLPVHPCHRGGRWHDAQRDSRPRLRRPDRRTASKPKAHSRRRGFGRVTPSAETLNPLPPIRHQAEAARSGIFSRRPAALRTLRSAATAPKRINSLHFFLDRNNRPASSALPPESSSEETPRRGEPPSRRVFSSAARAPNRRRSAVSTALRIREEASFPAFFPSPTTAKGNPGRPVDPGERSTVFSTVLAPAARTKASFSRLRFPLHDRR